MIRLKAFLISIVLVLITLVILDITLLKKIQTYYKTNDNSYETWYKVLSWFITINLVIIGLYIFSGEPYKLISHVLKK